MFLGVASSSNGGLITLIVILSLLFTAGIAYSGFKCATKPNEVTPVEFEDENLKTYESKNPLVTSQTQVRPDDFPFVSDVLDRF